MRIGELSQITGIPVRTIRYYEQIGLLHEPERTDSGYRIFSDQHVQRSRFIRRARGLGFSLEQIRSILDVATSEGSPCKSVRSVVHQNIEVIDQRISGLIAMRDLLSETLDKLDSDDSSSSDGSVCPVVESQASPDTATLLDSPVDWRV